jgi:beta-glucanase (GH16 family)
MKRLACALLGILAAAPAAAEEYKLVWSDEFNTPGMPDPAKWDYEEGYIRNNEQQYYTRARKENARVEEGCLVLEARKEPFKNPGFDPETKDKKNMRKGREFADYTSASLITRGKAAWTCGKIEVKAKLPTGRGMWPAIWTLGTDKTQGWPACGELDIMENVGFDPDIIHANIHTKKYNHVLKTNKGAKITIPAPHTAFHTYWIEWTPEKIDFYVDEKKYFTYENEKSGPDAWPYDKDQYLILNIAVGGAWGGQKGVDDAVFPQKMFIDYVRVYQKPR